MRLTDLLALIHVPRWSIVPMLRTQSVAEHSHRVAVISMELAVRLNKAELALPALYYAIIHDGGESRSGDIPHLFKREISDVLDEAEIRTCPWLVSADVAVDLEAARIVKMADLIEAYTWIYRWGWGPHAVKVKNLIYGQMMGYADANGFGGIIGEVVAAINQETGR